MQIAVCDNLGSEIASCGAKAYSYVQVLVGANALLANGQVVVAVDSHLTGKQ